MGRWLGFLGAWDLLKGVFVGVVSECSRGTLRREGVIGAFFNAPSRRCLTAVSMAELTVTWRSRCDGLDDALAG